MDLSTKFSMFNSAFKLTTQRDLFDSLDQTNAAKFSLITLSFSKNLLCSIFLHK